MAKRKTKSQKAVDLLKAARKTQVAAKPNKVVTLSPDPKVKDKVPMSKTQQKVRKAVNVAMELDKQQGLTISKIINLISGMDQNMKLLATKVLELEKKVESLEGYANREL